MPRSVDADTPGPVDTRRRVTLAGLMIAVLGFALAFAFVKALLDWSGGNWGQAWYLLAAMSVANFPFLLLAYIRLARRPVKRLDGFRRAMMLTLGTILVVEAALVAAKAVWR